MKKVLVIVSALAVTGVAGFFMERFLRGDPPPPEGAEMAKSEAMKPPPPPLFQMPLGKFTMRVTRRNQVVHLLFDLDVYMQGEVEFGEMNGAMGRAKLRDAVTLAVAELAETARWSDPESAVAQTPRTLAEQIVRKLHPDYPMVVTGRVNRLAHSASLRESFLPAN